MRAEHKQNAVWWNETATWYGSRDAETNIDFLRSGGSYLAPPEREMLRDLKSWCSRAIHLQCSHGNDLLSLLNEGVSEGIGVDISDRLLEVAQLKAERLNANAHFILSDVLDTPNDLNGTADLVYTGKGAICWMMDIDAWARVVSRLLKPGGTFLIYESHPLDWVWSTDEAHYVLDDRFGDYFSEEFRTRLFAAETENSPMYRQWTLAQTVNSLIDAGLVINRLMEYSEPFWNQFPQMTEETTRRLPHTFAIRATKP